MQDDEDDFLVSPMLTNTSCIKEEKEYEEMNDHDIRGNKNSV